jgi:crotonobetainyl-CoA:carnitine CoA-transferase CaiB-like acyl-CoA transferase
VQNLAPGAAARLGFGAADLVARHDRLVALDIVGYGQDTGCGAMRAYDMLVQAESGICAVTGPPDTACKVGVSIADIGTGMTAHAALLEALLGRARSGRGRAIEIALFDTMAEWMSVPLLHWEQAGQATPRVGLAHASIYPYGSFACRDGEIALAVQNGAEWRRLCEQVLGQPALIDDPRFADNPSRVRHREALAAVIAERLAGLTRAAAIDRLAAAGIAWGRLSSVADLSRHPGLHRIEVGLPSGSFAGVAPPLHRDLAAGPVPALGQDTARIRREFAA